MYLSNRLQLCTILLGVNLSLNLCLLSPDIKTKTIVFAALSLGFFLCKKEYIELYITDLIVFAFIASIATSTILSPYHLCIPLVFVLLTAFLSYWLLCKSFFANRAGKQMAIFFLRVVNCFTLSVALLGLYEYLSFAFLGKSNGMLIPYVLPASSSARVTGIYGQPNLFCLLLLSGILSFFYSYLHDSAFSQAKCRIKMLYFLPLFVVALCLFLTGSRAGLLAMLCTVLFMCFVFTRKQYLAFQPTKRRRFSTMLVVLVFAYFASLLLNYFFSVAGTRVLVSDGVSVEARFVFWAAAWLIFLDHPWFGIGLGNYELYLPAYLPKAHQWLGFVQYEAMGYTKWAHNEFLQLTCEGGVFVLLLLVFLLGCFGYQLVKFARGSCKWCPLKLYSHLFLIPFIVQSMFSWPLRHPGLLVLFFTFVALLTSQYPVRTLTAPSWAKCCFKSFAFIGLIAVVFITVQEIKIGLFARDMTFENARDRFSRFESLIAEPCTTYPLLLYITPRYVKIALKQKDVEFGEQILPYVEGLARMQGAHWQWGNLASVYNLLGQREHAHKAIAEAIEVRPSEDKYWAFQHYLNMQDASEKTGRPLEEFLPIPPGGDAADFKGLFDIEHNFRTDTL